LRAFVVVQVGRLLVAAVLPENIVVVVGTAVTEGC